MLEVDAPGWASFLDEVRHDFYHLPAYVALCALLEQGRPCAVEVVDGERRMLLPLIIREISDGGIDATSPYGYPGPLLHGPVDLDFIRAALLASAELLHAKGAVSIFIRLHPLINTMAPDGVGTVVRHGDTVSVDLSLSRELLWAQTRMGHRRDIKRAAQLGWVARMDEAWIRYDEFKSVYRETMLRRSAAQPYFFDDVYWQGLRAALGPRLHLCVVEKDATVGAAALFVETDGLVEYHLSGTNDCVATDPTQPSKLMIDFACSWAKQRGNRVLHLGGGVGAGNDTLLSFKLGFSPIRHSFRTLRIVVDEAQYRRLVQARDPRLDPAARDGFFPLYRLPIAA